MWVFAHSGFVFAMSSKQMPGLHGYRAELYPSFVSWGRLAATGTIDKVIYTITAQKPVFSQRRAGHYKDRKNERPDSELGKNTDILKEY